MIVGLTAGQFTFLHVIVSFLGIAFGLIVMGGLVQGRQSGFWTFMFLLFTVATTVTGFLFPLQQPFPSPAFITGVISSLLLVVALFALYAKHMIGSWRWIYLFTAILAQWFNSFVFVVQTFDKVPSLKAMPAPSPAFLTSQAIVLALHVFIGIVALRKFHPELGTARL
ncbi:MAG: hypothetical protein JO254_09305 [Pseudolabrys sp.]|nr:hypothetical protein [Pseudolabrys sp.]